MYIPRSQGGRGLCSVADVIEGECRSLGLYVEKSSEPLLQAVHAKKWFSSESTSEFKARMISLHYDNWSQKALHGQFCRETATHVDNKWQWAWLKSSRLSPEVEGYLFAAQEQAITTNVMNKKIFKLSVSPLCRLCHSADETIDHLISSCSYIAQTQYKKRHDLVASYVHWNLAKIAGFYVHEQWWKHVPEKVLDNSDWKILWDYTIQTGSSLPHNRPDITFCNKQSAETKFIDISIPGDSRISQKSVEKRDRYRDLSVIVSRLWSTSTMVVPVIVGALGSIPINLHQSLNSIGLPSTIIPVIQKSVLLSTSRILRHYLF